MPDYAELFSAAAQLPVDERMRLIDELTDTIPDPETGTFSQEWLDEIERRNQDIDAGTAELEDWEDVRDQLIRRVNAPNES